MDFNSGKRKNAFTENKHKKYNKNKRDFVLRCFANLLSLIVY